MITQFNALSPTSQKHPATLKFGMLNPRGGHRQQHTQFTLNTHQEQGPSHYHLTDHAFPVKNPTRHQAASYSGGDIPADLPLFTRAPRSVQQNFHNPFSVPGHPDAENLPQAQENALSQAPTEQRKPEANPKASKVKRPSRHAKYQDVLTSEHTDNELEANDKRVRSNAQARVCRRRTQKKQELIQDQKDTDILALREKLSGWAKPLIGNSRATAADYVSFSNDQLIQKLLKGPNGTPEDHVTQWKQLAQELTGDPRATEPKRSKHWAKLAKQITGDDAATLNDYLVIKLTERTEQATETPGLTLPEHVIQWKKLAAKLTGDPDATNPDNARHWAQAAQKLTKNRHATFNDYLHMKLLEKLTDDPRAISADSIKRATKHMKTRTGNPDATFADFILMKLEERKHELTEGSEIAQRYVEKMLPL